MYSKVIKPIIDCVLAILILVITLPVFVILIIILSVANNGTPFFFQKRPGKNAVIFKVIKFKTMNNKRDAYGNLLSDADRITPIGSFIRKTSLDELPQLLNVIKGDISLVGPRPLLVEYLSLYNKEQSRRHEIRPGITGWAQVNGRNTISWEQKFEHDVWYVDNLNFTLDMKILFLTVIKVFKSEGISSNSSVTMEPFKGNN